MDVDKGKGGKDGEYLVTVLLLKLLLVFLLKNTPGFLFDNLSNSTMS